jgi:hypothetical protein
MTQPPGGTGPAGDASLNVSRLSAAVNGKRLVTGGGFDLRPWEIVGLLGERQREDAHRAECARQGPAHHAAAAAARQRDYVTSARLSCTGSATRSGMPSS